MLLGLLFSGFKHYNLYKSDSPETNVVAFEWTKIASLVAMVGTFSVEVIVFWAQEFELITIDKRARNIGFSLSKIRVLC